MKDDILRSMLPAVRVARLVQRLGDVRPKGPLPTTRDLAAHVGEPFDVTLRMLSDLEGAGWVQSVEHAMGLCWRPTRTLPAVEVDYDVPPAALAGVLLSAALTTNARGFTWR